MLFPKRTKSKASGDIGIAIVDTVVTKDLGMIFRRMPQDHDYGIDGFIDYVVDSSVTGGTVAVQVKHGDSYFLKETVDGYWYEDSIEHLNYYFNHPAPVFIFLIHPKTERIHWVHLSGDNLHGNGNTWSILVPKDNLLQENFLSKVRELLDIQDISKEIKESTKLKDALARLASSAGYMTIFGISREVIESQNTLGIVSFFESLRRDKNRAKKSQGKITFFISGYDDDSRELYAIPEVVSFFKKVEPQVKYWFYFLSTDSKAHGLKVLLASVCGGTVNPKNGNIFLLDRAEEKAFMERNFGWLNEMTIFLGLPMEENKRISLNIFRYLGVPEDYIKTL